MSRQFSSHQEFYPARSGGTIGGDRKAATALVYQDVVAGVISTVAIQGDDGSIIAIQATALNTDQVIINAAIVYVGALGGGSIFTDEALYNISASIVNGGQDNIILEGAGDNTVFRLADNTSLAVFLFTDPVGWTLRDFRIDGNKANQVAGDGILFNVPDYCMVDSVTIVDCDDEGIHFGWGNEEVLRKNWIINNTVENCDLNGILADFSVDAAGVIIISENTCSGNGSAGIQLEAIYAYVVMGNRCIENVLGIWAGGGRGESVISSNSLSFNTQHGLHVSGVATGIGIVGNELHGNHFHGIFIEDDVNAFNCLIAGNNLRDNSLTNNNTYDNIYVEGTGHSIVSNVCVNYLGGFQTRYGINLVTATNCVVTGNSCNDHLSDGILLTASPSNTVTGNTCIGNTLRGIRLVASDHCTVTGNTFSGNTRSGISLFDTDHTVVSGNTCNQNVRNGIYLDASQFNTIVGNQCIENDVGNTGTYDGINIEDDSDFNTVHSNICNDNDRWGISIGIAVNDCVGNWVKNNTLIGNTSGAFFDGGTDTKLQTIPIPLIQGTAFVSTAGEAWGWEIDADPEFALGVGWLPLEVQQVVRIRVIGVGLAAPGAGNYMRIQITGEGATFDEVFSTESIDVVDKNNEEVNFAIDDVINWVFDATDDADIGDLLGGDRLQIKILHEGAGNGDIATDAIVDSIQVEVV